MYFILVIYALVLDVTSERNTNQLTEYCLFETFDPQCNSDEIIVIQEALYGRIRVGRCIQTNFFLGCSVSVLDITDKMCSGRSSCSIQIPNTDMTNRLDCLQDPSLGASSNLEANYICQKVYTPRETTCRAPDKIQVTKDLHHIASRTSHKTACGLHGSPWILQAEPGQQIEISMMDFSWTNTSEGCPFNYGYILDMDSDGFVNICGGTLRDKHVYTSTKHSVQIVLDSNAVERDNFVLSFKAVGCPQFQSPPHSWVQKENDSLIVGCVTSENTWKIKCVDNRWLGLVGNCTPPKTPTVTVQDRIIPELPGDRAKSKTSVSVPRISNNHVIVFTVACLTVLLCCVIIITGVYFIKRYDTKIQNYNKNSNNSNYFNTITTFQNGRVTVTRIPTTYKPVTQGSNLPPPSYTLSQPKSEQGPQVPPRNASVKIGGSNDTCGDPFKDRNATYENITGDDESVKYYILENPDEIGHN